MPGIGGEPHSFSSEVHYLEAGQPRSHSRHFSGKPVYTGEVQEILAHRTLGGIMKGTLLSILMAAFAQAAFSQTGDTVTTPEPGTVALLSIGVACIGFAAWRRNRPK